MLTIACNRDLMFRASPVICHLVICKGNKLESRHWHRFFGKKNLKLRPHLHAQFNTVLLWQHGARTAVVLRKFVHRDNFSSVLQRFEFKAVQNYCLSTIYMQPTCAPLPYTHGIFVTFLHSFSSPFRSPSILLRISSAWGSPTPSPTVPLPCVISWYVLDVREFR